MSRDARLVLAALVLVTTAVAAAGARPYAGSWNDGSRLAAAESLVDGGGWVIDRSIYVAPGSRPAGAPAPYPVSDRLLMERGTLDRLLIGGHYVSDKTPVSSLMLAGEYWLLQRAAGIVARVEPDRFAYWLTIVSSGVSFVLATAAMFMLIWQMSRSTTTAAGVAGSFAFATCAAAYSRHVNAHEMLLAVFALLMWQVDALVRHSHRRSLYAFSIGTLCGVAYGLDAALGPIALVLATALFLFVSPSRVWLFALAAAPWVALQHLLNYAVGGTLGPPNGVPAYLAWPGSPFDEASMTGRYTHATPWHAVIYSLDLLVGRRGFLLHNLPLLLLPVAAWDLVRARGRLREWPAVVFALGVMACGWLIYGVLSTNRSGVALSIRWFVPLLAPAFYVLGLHLRERAADRPLFLALSVIGVAMGLTAWAGGPWVARVPLFWWWVSTAILTCVVMARRRWRLNLT